MRAVTPESRLTILADRLIRLQYTITLDNHPLDGQPPSDGQPSPLKLTVEGFVFTAVADDDGKVWFCDQSGFKVEASNIIKAGARIHQHMRRNGVADPRLSYLAARQAAHAAQEAARLSQ